MKSPVLSQSSGEQKLEEGLERGLDDQPLRRQNDLGPETGVAKPVTACFHCRALRQKCDRKLPCSRCSARQRPCRYPSGSNRGRKPNTAISHSVSVDKLLSRISETAERDQVVAALLDFAGGQYQDIQRNAAAVAAATAAAASSPPPAALGADKDGADASPPDRRETRSLSPNHHRHSGSYSRPPHAAGTASEPEFQASLVSSFQIVAAAIAADSASFHQSPGSPVMSAIRSRKDFVDERLARYFATQITQQKDWQVLAGQSIDSPLKLETSTCDPVAARLIDHNDVTRYFQLFFKYRSPLIGILDPALHTPEYVHESSFVLFSALCALGCAVSDRPRDRVVYPALMSLAEGNMKWAIAVCVKSLEIIQAIICMQYWAPVCQKQSDDPYWLRLSHAVQLGRELGINRSAVIAEHVQAIAGNESAEFRERLVRDFERTWLCTFMSDKSFGLITGRSMGVSLKEIPASAGEWWRKPMTAPYDRVLSGIVELRGLFLNAMEQRKNVEDTLSAIAQWHSQAYQTLEQTRNARCLPDNSPSAQYIPLLCFYLDHSIMVLNAQALRDMVAIDQTGGSPELMELSAKTFTVASRLLETTLHNEVLQEFKVGFHNNQLIMVCHAATEILGAIQRTGLSLDQVAQAAAQVRAIPGHLDKVAAMLPATSATHLYASLSRFFVSQLDRVVRNTDTIGQDERGEHDQDSLLADWWKTVDGGLLDTTTWMDLGFLSSDQHGISQEWSMFP
ncbi:fungal transcriptional regulatory protein [Grosmannia clavigera kw1407]|uniref:Fungal transcriptional regulatory protein n=1 Tax=Grosmannia clavigera (strain kw1407 / UAMH 11150) TaxID=655863 RepID=F0XHY6_GROCL|nr:fungal transcriptional regulatory protein [Grosmannia clavigera kw1407]EFX03249.1 fungal transcriptional regulatory protein [Grosmannia clavigera kw1407]